MRSALVCAAAILAGLAAGCSSAGRTAERPLEASGKPDIKRLWSASLEVVGLRYAIKTAEEDAGTIETDYLTGPLSQTGPKANVVTVRDGEYETLHTIRSRALVKLDVQAADPVTVRVEKQRLVRLHSDVLPRGTFSMDSTRPAEEAAASERWIDEGEDAELEAVIRREITARYHRGPS